MLFYLNMADISVNMLILPNSFYACMSTLCPSRILLMNRSDTTPLGAFRIPFALLHFSCNITTNKYFVLNEQKFEYLNACAV